MNLLHKDKWIPQDVVVSHLANRASPEDFWWEPWIPLPHWLWPWWLPSWPAHVSQDFQEFNALPMKQWKFASSSCQTMVSITYQKVVMTMSLLLSQSAGMIGTPADTHCKGQCWSLMMSWHFLSIKRIPLKPCMLPCLWLDKILSKKKSYEMKDANLEEMHNWRCKVRSIYIKDQLPPSDSWSSLVSLESRNGTWVMFGSALALIHLPAHNN